MEATEKTTLTIQATVKAPADKIWAAWNEPAHIQNWAFASDDWHAPYAENDLREGGRFKTTMAAKDGSFSFDFSGQYTKVVPNEHIAYTMDDGRKVVIDFAKNNEGMHITESFEAESQNPLDMQQAGWQQILNNFKSYTESLK